MARRLRARGWCFTINNDTYDDLDLLLDMDFKYMIFGFEIGENKTPHIQGYVNFHNPRDLGGVKKLIPRAHLEIARGSYEDNYIYCSKEGDFYEFGDPPEPGKRSDLLEIKKMILKKDSMNEIADSYFTDYIRYYKGFEKFRDIQIHQIETVRYVEIKDLDYSLPDCMYVSKESQLWGYDNESILVILNQKMFDTYQLMMLEKGNPYLFNSKKICPRNVIIVK